VRRTWAVARNMVAEAVRMKIALVLLIVLVAVIPIGPFVWEGDGTLKGRVQTFLTYSTTLVVVVLSILTVFVACQSLSKEVSEHQIYTIASKPLPRWQFIFGKWLGMCLLNGMLLTACGLAIYLFAKYLDLLPAPWLEKAALRYEVLTARQGVLPPVPDFTEVVEQRYEGLKKSGRLSKEEQTEEGAKRLKAEFHREARTQWRTIPPSERKTWVFEGLRPGPKCDYVHIRYKMQATPLPPRMQVDSVWLIGDLSEPGNGPIPRTDSINQWHYFPVSSRLVRPDGTLWVTFVNRPIDELNQAVSQGQNRSTVAFEEPDGLEVLYEVGSFEGNFVRSMLLIFAWLMPLAALGLFAGSFLSFPVGSLLCSSVLVASALADFVRESLYWVSERPNPQQDPLDYFSWMFKPFIQAVIHGVPQLGRYSPIDLLADGRVITWGSVAAGVGMMVLLQAALYLVLSIVIFSRRELAEVTV